MKRVPTSLAGILLLSLSISLVAQTKAQNSPPITVLRNGHVLLLVEAQFPSKEIIELIHHFPCQFDIFPPALNELKFRGVPDSVLQAMREAPYGPPRRVNSPPPPKLMEVTIPQGTVVEFEAPYSVSSSSAKAGSEITFRVSRTVKVNGTNAIAPGALATARVVKSKGGGSWGRPGELAWDMKDVVAIDGKRIPLKFEQQVRGENKGDLVASGTAATVVAAGISFPLVSPVAVLWGFLKGEDAVIPSGRRFTAVVRSPTQVSVLEPQERSLSYHEVAMLRKIATQQPASFERLQIGGILHRF